MIKNRTQNNKVHKRRFGNTSNTLACPIPFVVSSGVFFARTYSAIRTPIMAKKKTASPAAAYTPVHFEAQPNPIMTALNPRGINVFHSGSP